MNIKYRLSPVGSPENVDNIFGQLSIICCIRSREIILSMGIIRANRSRSQKCDQLRRRTMIGIVDSKFAIVMSEKKMKIAKRNDMRYLLIAIIYAIVDY